MVSPLLNVLVIDAEEGVGHVVAAVVADVIYVIVNDGVGGTIGCGISRRLGVDAETISGVIGKVHPLSAGIVDPGVAAYRFAGR